MDNDGRSKARLPIASPAAMTRSGDTSDTQRLPLDMRPELSSQRLLGDELNRTPQQVLEVEQDAEVALGRRRAVEPDEYIDVAVRNGSPTRNRAEQSEARDAVALGQNRLALGQHVENLLWIHWRPRDQAQLSARSVA